jgi:hypothetical protein
MVRESYQWPEMDVISDARGAQLTHEETDKRRKSTSQTAPSSILISKGSHDASSGKKEENSFDRKSDSSECRICLC